MDQRTFTKLAQDLCRGLSDLHVTRTLGGFKVTSVSRAGKLKVRFKDDNVMFDYADLGAVGFAVERDRADALTLRRSIEPLLGDGSVTH